MSNIRNKFESFFGRLAGWIYENRIKTLCFVALLFTLCVFSLPKITIDTSSEGFLHTKDPALIDYEEFKKQFGMDEMIIISLKPKNVFDISFLEKLRDLHNDLKKNVPYIDDITSLINARNTIGKKDELIVEDLFETWPKTKQELEQKKKWAMENEMYKNLLLSEDGSITTIIMKTSCYAYETKESQNIDILEDFGGIEDFTISKNQPTKQPANKYQLTDAQNSEIIKSLQEVLKRHDFEDTQIYTAGIPVVYGFLKKMMMKDMRKFALISIFAITCFLFVMFRRVSGVFMPILIVILSLISTFGLMAAFGTSIKLPTQILPSFLLAVGIGDSVHILVIFFRELNMGADKKKAIINSMSHAGLAIFMTSLTTAGGLLSFAGAEVAPISDMGLYASAGVLLALIYTVTLLPAFLSLFPIRRLKQKTGLTESKGFGSIIGYVSINHPFKVLIISGIILTAGAIGVKNIYFSHSPLSWLPKTSHVRISSENIDKQLKGSAPLEIVIDTGKENGLYEPDLLNRLEQSAAFLEAYHDGKVFVGKAWTITSILKETNKALHANDVNYYKVPQQKDLIAQELFLFENSGSDDLEDITDSTFSKVRLTAKLPFTDAVAYKKLMSVVHNHFDSTYPEHKITLTGMAALFIKVINNAIISMAESYLIAFVIITFLMILLIGRLKFGLAAMVPNLAPIILTIGVMGWLNIPLDLFNMLVGSIAIGLAVDDTIHFMHNFRRFFEEKHDPAYAVIKTLDTTGRAMLVTTLVLSTGFFTFWFADMKNILTFGTLTGFTLIGALLADFFIAPALMVIINDKKGEL